ncbi:MAG: zinc-ribbon domain-containing protein [Bdellovibrionaceae bacterium]|nr:zinc-ribbon domain-containing protein [Pseudobdellovibrionaceae bacterium]
MNVTSFDATTVISWIAIVILSCSYWFQIWKIHIHKEVRDLSMVYHILLAVGFGVLTYTAWKEDSTIFLVKQIATTIPVLVIIGQILVHKKDHWHDDSDEFCVQCSSEIEQDWKFCPYCGHAGTSA